MDSHNKYGFNEAEQFATFASQTSLQHKSVKKAELPATEQNSFKTEKGQPLTDLVELNFKG